MIVFFEWVIGVGLGIEYFDEEDAWIFTLFLIRLIVLPKGLDE